MQLRERQSRCKLLSTIWTINPRSHLMGVARNAISLQVTEHNDNHNSTKPSYMPPLGQFYKVVQHTQSTYRNLGPAFSSPTGSSTTTPSILPYFSSNFLFSHTNNVLKHNAKSPLNSMNPAQIHIPSL